MPNPNMRRGLKAGTGGKREGAGRIAADNPGRKFWAKMLKNPKFVAALTSKVEDMTVHPSVLTAGMYYGWGKPPETIDVKQVVPVTIRHEYADEDPKKKDTKS